MIDDFFLPQLEKMDLANVWFQQNGATAHMARPSIIFLREHFPERLISFESQI